MPHSSSIPRRVSDLLTVLSAALGVTVAILVVLLRPSGLLGYRFAGDYRLPPVVLETVALAIGSGLLLTTLSNPYRVRSIAVLFGASSFLLAEGLVFAFVLDATGVGLQLSGFAGLLAGVMRVLSSDRKKSGVRAGGIGIAVGIFMVVATTVADNLVYCESTRRRELV